MASSLFDSFYFKNMFSTSAMAAVFSDESRINAWLTTEIALAKGEAKVGVIPKDAADNIAASACLSNIDLDLMKVEFDKVGFPILPLVRQIANACNHDAARWVHWGATTQDIVDTGLVLQMREGLSLLQKDLRSLMVSLAKIASTHRNTVMAGRTFQQQAAPITFGYKVAVWLNEMLRHHERLIELKKRVLVGQLGGAVGTLSTLGQDGIAVQQAIMEELGLKKVLIPWHTSRDSWAEMVNWLVLVCSTLGKIGTEISGLMRTEVNEVREPYEKGRGASSTMPQKRNPIACPRIIAISHRMREFSGSQFSAMIQEHERGVSAMPIEWMIIPEAFMLASASFSQSLEMISNLEIDSVQMGKNLNLDSGLLMAEAIMMGIAPLIGRTRAHELVFTAAANANDTNITLREAIINDEKIMELISVDELNTLLNPVNYTGSASEMIDAVLNQMQDILTVNEDE